MSVATSLVVTFEELIMSKLYHIDADYIPVRADVSPPHWVCGTLSQAEMLVAHIKTTMRNIQNVRIRD